MRLVYMDEAGTSRKEPHVVVAGVIIDADRQLVAVERHLEKLVPRFVPESLRDGFVFHATEIFNGGGKVFKRHDPEWPMQRRLEVADALARTLTKFSLPVVFGSVEKGTFKPKLADGVTWSEADYEQAAHMVALMSAAMQVETWMRKRTSGEVCLLIHENTETARKMITDTLTTYQNPAEVRKLYGGDVPAEEAPFFPFKRIKQRPLFEPKAPNSALQLADFIAHAFKKMLVGDPRYRDFVQPILSSVAVQPDDLPKRSKPT